MKPILFNSEMVRAILDGRKTQTRRIVKPQPEEILQGDWSELCPYGKVGDRLWVRETFKYMNLEHTKVGYKASIDETCNDGAFIRLGNWRPSIHMPKWAARIFLEITNIRVERVQDITSHDCIAEGLPVPMVCDATEYRDQTHLNLNKSHERIKEYFQKLWDSINKKRGYGWEDNPWVWVIEFVRRQT